ncbi:MAG: hypothetical protein K5695_03545 [Oscillospiraceae bacterium]|nr:hypothetical protein [Oscillospiraceae bacterium]
MKGFKRRLTAVTAAFLLGITGITQLPAAALSENEHYYLGDISGNDLVDVQDIILLQKQLLGLPVQLEVDRVDLADIDRNDVIDVFDLGYLKKLVLGTARPEDFLPEDPEPPQESDYISPIVTDFGWGMPTYGNVRVLTIFAEFSDVKFDRSTMLSAEAVQESLFGEGNEADYPFDSLTNWYDRASYGALHVTGDVVYYTCKGKMSDYSDYDDNGYPDYEPFVKEVLQGLDDQIDYRDYDSDHNGMIDCLCISVPADDLIYEGNEYWWSCTSTWYGDYSFDLDGEYINSYITTDDSPTADKLKGLKSTLTHEMGHAMGLTDYYLYGVDSHWDSSDGFEGEAGYERMDDSVGDLCSFSKIALGWMREDEAIWYDSGKGSEQTFELESISEKGNCLILPIDGENGDYTTEYFIVEYVTPTNNNVQLKDYCWYHDSGVRIFHADAELITDRWNSVYFKYDPLCPYYTCDGERRLLRLVNEGDTYASFGGKYTFYQPGDVCKYGVKNFAGYDSGDKATLDTGYTVTVNRISNGKCSVTVTKK